MKKPNRTIALIAASVTAVAAAQQVPKAPPLTSLEMGAFHLANPVVQSELKVSPDQAKEIAKAFVAHAARQDAVYAAWKPDAGEANNDANSKQLERLDQEFAKSAIRLLTTDQAKRLRELSLQFLGVGAMQFQDVSQELGLSGEQLAGIRQHLVEYEKKSEELQAELGAQLEKLGQPKPGDMKAEREFDAAQARILETLKPKQVALTQFKVETDRKILALLAPAQQKKWETLLGERFVPKG